MKNYLRLIRFVFPHAWVLALAGVCMAFSSMLQGASITAVIPLVDNVLREKKIVLNENIPSFPLLDRVIDKVNSMPALELLYALVAFGLVFWLLKSFFDFCQTYFMNDVSQRVIRDVKNVLYNKLIYLSLDYYSKNPTGKLVSRITYDASIIRDSISAGLTDLLYQPIQLSIYITMVFVIKLYFSISWVLIMVIFVLLVLVIYPVAMIGRKLKSISRRSQEQMADINTTLYETISGIRVVKAFSTEDFESEKVAGQNQRFYKLAMKSIKRMTVLSPITEFVGILCFGAVLWVVGEQIVTGGLSAGAFTAFSVALFSIMKPIKRLTKLYGINQQALAAGARIFEVLDAKPTVVQKPGAVELPRIASGVEFRDATFSYETDENAVLKDIDLNVKVGSVAAFVGPSGAGKTSLVNLIPRFYDATSGEILIDGVNVKDATIKSLRRQIGIVTQETILFNDTVANNITYGFDAPEKDDVERAAKIANAHGFISKLPKGYDTFIGERGFRLSGGEKQRIAIARAVFKDPPILILDEATSQLDTESEVLVQNAIDNLMEGRTVFVIAHRLSTVKKADTIYVLNAGRIVEEGPHEKLIRLEGLYKRLYNIQFRENVLL
ncbi:MAG: ABC transporter ATP-binding protein [Candidatus Omnitrophota bacterium]